MIKKYLYLLTFCLTGAACLIFSSCELDGETVHESNAAGGGSGDACDIKVLGWWDLKPGTWSGRAVSLTTAKKLKDINSNEIINNADPIADQEVEITNGFTFKVDEKSGTLILENILCYAFLQISKANASYLDSHIVIPIDAIYNRYYHILTMQYISSYDLNDASSGIIVGLYMNRTGDTLVLRIPFPASLIYNDVVMHWQGN